MSRFCPGRPSRRSVLATTPYRRGPELCRPPRGRFAAMVSIRGIAVRPYGGVGLGRQGAERGTPAVPSFRQGGYREVSLLGIHGREGVGTDVEGRAAHDNAGALG